MAKHTLNELRQWQALPLSIKVRMTEERIRMWVREYGESGVYVSFSGGKDSTVLSHLVDRTIPNNDIPRVFVNTGLEYPEIVQFVKQEPRAVILKPSMNFRQVIEKYGYPFFSKEVSEAVYGARRYLNELTHRQTDRVTLRTDIFLIKSADLANMLNERMQGRKGGANFRLARMMGMLTKDNQIKANIPNENRSMFACERYKFMLEGDAPIISNKCCMVMKKTPSHKYSHKTGRVCITGEMAEESRQRTQKWIQNGCNGFHLTEPKSTPMAFWTEQDVLQYIKENNIQIASVYGEIVYDEKKSEQLEGQLEFGANGIEEAKCALKTTGCKRTGCMFCGYGCHLEREGEGRFERLRVTHPKIYEWIFKDWDKGGLGYKKVIDWMNENGNLSIKY